MLPSTKAVPQVVTSDLLLQALAWKGKKGVPLLDIRSAGSETCLTEEVVSPESHRQSHESHRDL